MISKSFMMKVSDVVLYNLFSFLKLYFLNCSFLTQIWFYFHNEISNMKYRTSSASSSLHLIKRYHDVRNMSEKCIVEVCDESRYRSYHLVSSTNELSFLLSSNWKKGIVFCQINQDIRDFFTQQVQLRKQGLVCMNPEILICVSCVCV